MTMQKLSRDDLFSLEQYAVARPEFREKVLEHKRDRRLDLGTNAARTGQPGRIGSPC